MTYGDVQPRANEIKDSVLARRMPPWGAVKGFGQFRNDQSLSQEQIELITKWVDGGIRRGNNPACFSQTTRIQVPDAARLDVAVRVRGHGQPTSLWCWRPHARTIGTNHEMRIVAVLPNGGIEPLLWLHDYDARRLIPSC
jgi:hypothetical protein